MLGQSNNSTVAEGIHCATFCPISYGKFGHYQAMLVRPKRTKVCAEMRVMIKA